MSKMIKCKTCGADIASSAKTCPGCGAKNKKSFYKKWWVWFIVVIVLIGAAGSGANSNNNSSTEAASSNKVDTKKETTKITYENFLNIQMGQSYDEVVALLGEGKESSSNELAGIKTTLYEWKGSGMGNMNVTIQNGAVTAKAQAFLQKPNANITMDLYNQIQNGMTYDQVKGILGEGELTSETKIMDSAAKLYSYINKDGSSANFTFTNDSMDLKAQFNLK